MKQVKNDATLTQLGNIYQYYIALKDCFEMNIEDKLQIEILGDVTVISDLKNFSFQKEVKHHIKLKKLSNQDIEFWKTLYNWYIEYESMKNFDKLILYTTSIISVESKFYNWNNLFSKDKLKLLKEIKLSIKRKNKMFEKYYNFIFKTNYDENKLLTILEKVRIESSQNNIKNIMKEFTPYIRYIPENNRKIFIDALLGQIIGNVKNYPKKWEITGSYFEKILQKIVPNYLNVNEIPLPKKYEKEKISFEQMSLYEEKEFVKAIKEIEYEEEKIEAIINYCKTEKTIIDFFKIDFLLLEDLDDYEIILEKKLKYIKNTFYLESENLERKEKIKKSKILYNNVMGWEPLNFGNIIKNRDFFQKGMIHIIVDQQKFKWYLD